MSVAWNRTLGDREKKRDDLPIEIKSIIKGDRERERDSKISLDSIVKNPYSNFSSSHSYLLNEKKREEEKEK